MTPHRWPFWIVLYLLLAGGLAAGLGIARQRVLVNLGSPEAIEQWQAWKETTHKGAEPSSPVKRRAVQSDEPPTLVLFRDHFGAILGSIALISSLLFFFVAALIRGLLGPRASAPTGQIEPPPGNAGAA